MNMSLACCPGGLGSFPAVGVVTSLQYYDAFLPFSSRVIGKKKPAMIIGMYKKKKKEPSRAILGKRKKKNWSKRPQF